MNKSCCSDNKQNKQSKWHIDPFVGGIILFTVLILGIVVVVGLKQGTTTSITADEQVALSTDSNTYSWGEIDIDGGIVTKSFAIQNTSTAPLKLYDVKTSCMCTTAQLKTSQSASGKYGMHEKSTDMFEVAPGETAELLVEFDPAFHGPSGVGPITRTITMDTNDAKNPTLTFNLTGNVVKK